MTYKDYEKVIEQPKGITGIVTLLQSKLFSLSAAKEEHHLSLVQNSKARRGSFTSHAFPELHHKKVRGNVVTSDNAHHVMSEGAGAWAPAAGDQDQDWRQGPETQRGGADAASPWRREVCRRIQHPEEPHHRGRQAPAPSRTRSVIDNLRYVSSSFTEDFVDIILCSKTKLEASRQQFISFEDYSSLQQWMQRAES